MVRKFQPNSSLASLKIIQLSYYINMQQRDWFNGLPAWPRSWVISGLTASGGYGYGSVNYWSIEVLGGVWSIYIFYQWEFYLQKNIVPKL